MSRGALARALGGAAILVGLVWRVGAGPFLDGLRAVDLPSVLTASAIALVTTTCCAWRWRIVARGLGVEVASGPAVAAYYRSQFLNTVLPGGVLGDVHRGVRHGRAEGDVGRGVRAVVWERTAGQLVLALVTAVVLLALPSPVQHAMPWIVALAMIALATTVVLVARPPAAGRTESRWARVRRTAVADVRAGLLAPRAWPGIVTASTVVVAGHAATFVVAARAVGVDAPLMSLVPLAFLALVAMSVPANLGGWGPREGMAAWAFGAAGLGAANGVATATAYGVLVVVATLPGGLVLAVQALRRPGTSSSVPDTTSLVTTAHSTGGSRA